IAGVLLQAQGPAAVLFAALWLGERLTWLQIGGSALLLCGSVLVVVQGGPALTWQGAGIGVLFVLAGAIGYGFSLIPAKRLAAQADPLQVSALRLLLGAIFVLPFLFFQSPLVVGTVSWLLGWLFGAYIVTNFCIGYITQQTGLRFLKAWEAAAIMQTVPLFTALFALVVLHETVTLLQLLGGVLVIVGGIIVARGETGISLQAPGRPQG
ncbi:MAG TPA: DMT family transporter, partial [Ktedonobacteraceae bacterium]|nr:DMT family transporter [Ktedonobacteraceae bacterium]